MGGGGGKLLATGWLQDAYSSCGQRFCGMRVLGEELESQLTPPPVDVADGRARKRSGSGNEVQRLTGSAKKFYRGGSRVR